MEAGTSLPNFYSGVSAVEVVWTGRNSPRRPVYHEGAPAPKVGAVCQVDKLFMRWVTGRQRERQAGVVVVGFSPSFRHCDGEALSFSLCSIVRLIRGSSGRNTSDTIVGV